MSSAQFPPTRWSVVLTVGSGDERAAAAALAELCEIYWFPLYSFVRRTGRSPEDAEDLTQSFFSRLIEKDVLGTAQAERGKLRSFLLGSLKNFLADEWDKSNAQKRGGGKQFVSIDAEVAEARYAMELPDEASPDHLFERSWAQSLLSRVLGTLRDHYEASGKQAVFDELHQFLASYSGDGNYRTSAQSLGMTENAVRVAIFRMRQRYAKTLRDEIAETVASDADIEAEIDFLFKAVS